MYWHLQFDMLPENMRAQAAQRLVDNVKSYNNHLTTGFLGTPYLCHVLTTVWIHLISPIRYCYKQPIRHGYTR